MTELTPGADAQDLTGDRGVLKEILKEGSGEPVTGKVRVHYTGWLASNGKKFDSSKDRGKPFEFELGAGQVIRAWDVGVATMKVGERARLFCAPGYAYGSRGVGNGLIPGDATLVFEVENLGDGGGGCQLS